MKKVLLFASAAAMLASCSDDDNNGSSGINGTWKVTAFTSSTPSDMNGDGTATGDIIAETGCYNNMTLVLSGSNTAVLNAQEASIDLDNGSLTCETLAPETGTYVQSGNQVTVTIDGDAVVMTKSGNKLTASEETEFGVTTMVLTKQ